MYEIFKNILTLSTIGFVITALLLCLKPVTSKKFPAKWQYYTWVFVVFTMLIPLYKTIPVNEVRKIKFTHSNEAIYTDTTLNIEQTPSPIINNSPSLLENNININQKHSIKLSHLLSYLWFFGMCIYILIIVFSYIHYIVRKNQSAVTVAENSILNEVKKELKIKRNIKIRITPDIQSPMLVGILIPTIYIPCREITDENLRMVFLHELTHYKRKDLIIKWIALLVNAIHWFNPLTYLLCANLSEACEISCDMEVTKNMSHSEQNLYMKTILDLVEKEENRC